LVIVINAYHGNSVNAKSFLPSKILSVKFNYIEKVKIKLNKISLHYIGVMLRVALTL